MKANWKNNPRRTLERLPVAFLFLVGFACTNGAPEYTAEELRAQEIWRRHEGVLTQGISGWRNPDDFAAAVDFFSEVSGIEVSVHFHPVMMPKPEAPEDLERLRAWYSKNKNRLYLDEETQKVQVNSVHNVNDSSSMSLRAARAQEIWTQHETVIVQTQSGQWTQPALTEACSFFARLAGIAIEIDLYDQEEPPYPKAQQNLRRVREWYSRNKDRLYFDEEAQRVHVNPRQVMMRQGAERSGSQG